LPRFEFDLSRRGVLALVTLAHRPSFSERPKSQKMGLPAIVQHPFSTTEVETKAATEAILASSNLAICVAPASAQNGRGIASRLSTSRRNRKYANCPVVKGKAANVPALPAANPPKECGEGM